MGKTPIMTKDLEFPENFLWGAAQSAYQTEGHNYNNDWYKFEQTQGNIKNNDICGVACDHYNRFDSDFELLSNLNQNAHRTGIEWSRIVPEENEVNHEEIEHYHKVFESLKKHNLTSFVTVHHFTIPLWFEQKGGFLKRKNLKHFEYYCDIIAKNFPEVEFWNTINEPGVLPLMGYMSKEFPPGKRSLLAFSRVYNNILRAHGIAYHKLKEENPKSQVGIVKNVPYFYQKFYNKFWKKWVVSLFDNVYNQTFFNLLNNGRISINPLIREKWLKGTSDFFGINYYDALYFKFKFGIPYGMDFMLPEDTRITQMGWGIHPNGLYENLMRVKKEFKGPIYVTENGIATLEDKERQSFILEHLIEVHRAIKNGADVQGFFYWSSMDNWEWAEGFEPRFGLLGIDYETQERQVRESAKLYGEIAKQNKISASLLEKFKLNA